MPVRGINYEKNQAKYQYKYNGKCANCNMSLPVPTWKTCQKCDTELRLKSQRERYQKKGVYNLNDKQNK